MNATQKQVDALVATGIPAAMARPLIDCQTTCVVCGNGMLVLPWAKIVDESDRLTFVSTDGEGDEKRIQIHRFCLLGPSVGGALAAALSRAVKPCQWDIDGRESVGLALLNGRAIPICEPHARDAGVEVVYAIPA